jgi:hypothetical protein
MIAIAIAPGIPNIPELEDATLEKQFASLGKVRGV